MPLADRWRQRRDRLLASPAFQHWAARFAPTRFVARQRARALFDLIAGFAYSQVLVACVRLDLFNRLLEGPQDAAVLAPQLGLDADALQRLLDAAVSLRLVRRLRDGRHALGALGAPLAGASPIAPMVLHHAAFYADLADPLALMRGNVRRPGLADWWPYARSRDPAALSSEAVARYSALMSASQPLVAEALLDAWPFHRHCCLLDVGGGEGGLLIAAGRRAPRLELMLFDLPAVVELARGRLADMPRAPRVALHGGDFHRDALPLGADLATLMRVLHDHDDPQALALLRRVHAALEPGGVILVAEPMAATRGAEPVGAAYFGLYLMAMGSGRPRTAAQVGALLAQAGFRGIRALATPLPLQARVLCARKPIEAPRRGPAGHRRAVGDFRQP
jgi:demethylspheroidene O-methyltransferase